MWCPSLRRSRHTRDDGGRSADRVMTMAKVQTESAMRPGFAPPGIKEMDALILPPHTCPSGVSASPAVQRLPA